MNKKELKEQKKEEKLRMKHEKIANGGKFKKWRNNRPFWGASLVILAGLLILYIPIQLYAIAFVPGSLVFIGFLFGGLMLITGVLGYLYPKFSTVFGIVAIFLSVLSVMGALGGFLIGTIIGIAGGALLIAWEKQEVLLETETETTNDNKTIEKGEVSAAQV
ncbi:DUF6114 domain-containing protein [Virgibacillus doumboii]|uniref:DUF6114 domain-containing protein n=1 Tax=Virgibacillus doumboii TaxID=2697503 RepID=UPI001967E9BA|nr:DUF6114 domain-containing protein [Virgibacillus doumboii]